MFFEGSEKKVELVVKGAPSSLRHLGEAFWRQIVKAAKAEIISTVENSELTAYLLSESSLFVWDDRFLMITCGRTRLIDAVKLFLEKKPELELASLIFQRKNEYEARQQDTSFFEDLKVLRERYEGSALRFGWLDGHHNFMYHLNRPFSPPENDSTTELLMYHIGKEAADILRCEKQEKAVIRKLLALDEIIPDFVLDDFVFEPCGYSLNAIKDDRYATIHITPQEGTSYVSFETNFALTNDQKNKLIESLAPQSFDLIEFEGEQNFAPDARYDIVQRVREKLKCGYQVRFTHYIKKNEEIDRATPILE